MQSWTFYPAFIATGISILSWTYFAHKKHLSHLPRTLSELASESKDGPRYYRSVLWICGPLFAITVFGFIIQRITEPLLIGIASTIMITTEMLVGVFLAERGKITAHDIIAGLMGSSMIALTFLFAWQLNDIYSIVELVLAIMMCLSACLCFIDRKRYLFYELFLIFLSHFSIIIAAIALS